MQSYHSRIHPHIYWQGERTRRRRREAASTPSGERIAAPALHSAAPVRGLTRRDCCYNRADRRADRTDRQPLHGDRDGASTCYSGPSTRFTQPPWGYNKYQLGWLGQKSIGLTISGARAYTSTARGCRVGRVDWQLVQSGGGLSSVSDPAVAITDARRSASFASLCLSKFAQRSAHVRGKYIIQG